MDFTNRQIEIIAAATKLIGEKGIQNLTTKNLANEMKFSEPALYRHFKGKTDILSSVLKYYRDELKEDIFNILRAETTGIEKIETIFKFQFAHFSRNPGIVMVIFSETSFQYDKELSQTVLEIMTQKKELMTNIIEFGQQDGSIRNDVNKNHLATIIMGSMRLTILRWRLTNFKFNLEEQGQVFFTTLKQLIQNCNVDTENQKIHQ